MGKILHEQLNIDNGTLQIENLKLFDFTPV